MKEREKKLNELANYYQSLSEIYLAEYQDHLRPSKLILAAMGVVVDMRSDLVLYRRKNPETEKSKRQSERLDLFTAVIDQFSVIADRNFQVKTLLKKYVEEIKSLNQHINTLEEQLTDLKRSIELHES